MKFYLSTAKLELAKIAKPQNLIVNSQSKFYSGQGGGTLFNRKSGIEFNMRSFLPERGK
jgi:hypothetical protein